MNLLSQLQAMAPKEKKPVKKKTKASNKEAMRQQRIVRWREAFRVFHWEATVFQLASVRDVSAASINTMLCRMSKEDPPLVMRCGQLPRTVGCPAIIWRWIGG